MSADGHLSAPGASLVAARPIAALFVAKGGTYFGLEGVDPWDEERDARLYDGPHPVVAHPPCGRWSRLAGLVEHRWGHRVGDDGGCFEAALRSIRTYGGVLEHPAFSKAWAAFGLPKPVARDGWTGGICGGWSCYVEQGQYGLPVAKPTWLYAYEVALPDLEWGSEWHARYRPGYVAKSRKSGEGWSRRQGGEGPLGRTSTTPPAFRDALLAIARTSRVTSEAAA